MKHAPWERRLGLVRAPGYGALAGLLMACVPAFDDRAPLVTEPQIAAVVTTPAEARPRTAVTLEAKLALPLGAEAAGPFAWSFCTTPVPLGDPRPIAAACGAEAGLPILGNGATVQATVPSDACARFGPDPRSGGSRAADPDDTGGYYQPIRVDALGARWFYLLRVTCELPNAPSDVARQLAQEYVPNTAPALAALEKFEDGVWVAFEHARPGQTLALRARWQPEAAEDFVYLPVGAHSLAARRESLRVRWLSTSGHFAVDASGRSESDTQTTAENAWTADATPNTVRFWLVLTDSRGASSVEQTDVDVRAP